MLLSNARALIELFLDSLYLCISNDFKTLKLLDGTLHSCVAVRMYETKKALFKVVYGTQEALSKVVYDNQEDLFKVVYDTQEALF